MAAAMESPVSDLHRTDATEPTPVASEQRPRRAYEAPRAEFVPLCVEERLMQCFKFFSGVTPACSVTDALS